MCVQILLVEVFYHFLLFYTRFSSASVCDPTPCGIFNEPWVHLPNRCFCRHLIPSASLPSSVSQPGAGWKALTHSLQPAETLWPWFPHSGPSSTSSPASTPATTASSSTAFQTSPTAECAASGAATTAVAHQAELSAGQESTSPHWHAAGTQVTYIRLIMTLDNKLASFG